ncbi:MFS transporter [Nitriliruptor alkaliphilus]|uniref:MFS transporter n=1 Tax=Nitriliruptor alkaliphilus TaxID=427918 RepID=UPI000695ABD8|nr:MFS transporter [Nitriliruptor alkaliphilus]
MRTPTRSTDRAPQPRPTLFTPAFIALAFASLAYFTAAGMLIPALPRFVEGPLGGGNVAVGLVFGTFSISAVLLRPAAGLYGDRRGRRPLMLAGAAVFALSVLAYGLAPTPAVLAGIRLVSGAGEALFFVGMATAFTDLAPAERRGEAMSLASLALYLGIGIGPVVAEVTIARGGLTAVWVATAATAALAALLVVRVPETRPTSPAPAPAATRHRLVHPAGVLPGIVLLASIVGMAGFVAFVPLHVLDIGMASSGVVLGVFAGIVVLIRSVGARLPDVLGPGRAIRAALTLSVIGLMVAGTWHTPAGLVLGAIVLAVGIALLTPSVFALAVADVPASERGQVMATTSAFIDIAFGAGPISMGLVAASFGRPAVFVAGAVAAGAGLVLVAATRLGRPRSEAVEHAVEGHGDLGVGVAAVDELGAVT